MFQAQKTGLVVAGCYWPKESLLCECDLTAAPKCAAGNPCHKPSMTRDGVTIHNNCGFGDGLLLLYPRDLMVYHPSLVTLPLKGGSCFYTHTTVFVPVDTLMPPILRYATLFVTVV